MTDGRTYAIRKDFPYLLSLSLSLNISLSFSISLSLSKSHSLSQTSLFTWGPYLRFSHLALKQTFFSLIVSFLSLSISLSLSLSLCLSFLLVSFSSNFYLTCQPRLSFFVYPFSVIMNTSLPHCLSFFLCWSFSLGRLYHLFLYHYLTPNVSIIPWDRL